MFSLSILVIIALINIGVSLILHLAREREQL